MFIIIELLFLLLLLYLIANIARFFFFKNEVKGGVFGLSDKWIKDEQKGVKK